MFQKYNDTMADIPIKLLFEMALSSLQDCA